MQDCRKGVTRKTLKDKFSTFKHETNCARKKIPKEERRVPEKKSPLDTGTEKQGFFKWKGGGALAEVPLAPQGHRG